MIYNNLYIDSIAWIYIINVNKVNFYQFPRIEDMITCNIY